MSSSGPPGDVRAPAASTDPPRGSDPDRVAALIEESSFGTAGARELRAAVPRDRAAEVVARTRDLLPPASAGARSAQHNDQHGDREQISRQHRLGRDALLIERIRAAGVASEAYRRLAIELDEQLTGTLMRLRHRNALHATVATTHGVELGEPRMDTERAKRIILDASAVAVCFFARTNILDGHWTPEDDRTLDESLSEVGLLVYAERYLAALAFGGEDELPLDPRVSRPNTTLFSLLRPDEG